MLVFDHERLRALRVARHWTIEEGARRFGLSYPMARKLESNAVRPSVTTLGRLAAALGVPMDELFREAPEQTVDVPTDLGADTDRWIEATLATAPPMTEEQARRVSAALFGRRSA